MERVTGPDGTASFLRLARNHDDRSSVAIAGRPGWAAALLELLPAPAGAGCIASHLAAAEAERTASAPRAVSASDKTFEGFTDEERAAMKERAQELKATARPAQ